MIDFPIVKIGELINAGEAEIQTGPFGTQLKASDYSDHGYPVINVRNVGFGDLRKENLEFINDRIAEKLPTHRLMQKDIVFGRKGAVERHGFIAEAEEGWYQGSDCLRLRFNSPRINPKFISYFLRTQAHQDWMMAVCAFGATMASLNQDIVKLINVPVPPIDIQNKIVGLLSAFDDLIENNKRRITLLEKMAEEIYREWFVRFRFPGWQEAEFEKGQPAGWTHQKIAEAFDFTGGGTPSKDSDSFWRNGDVDWYTPSDITKSNSLFMASSEYQCNEEGLRRSSAKLFPAYSVMMTSRATIGAIGINTKPACTNQGFITCIPNDRYPLTYLYHWLKAAKPHFEMLSGGATFPELIKSTFKRIEILSPEHGVVEKFDGLVSPMFKQMESLAEQNRKLEQTKTQLLPRLISGKLSVENLGIQFPPSMQSDQLDSSDEAAA